MILITGADGFIGSYLFNKLTEWGIACTGTYFNSVDLSSRTSLYSFVQKIPNIKLIIHCATAARSGTDYDYDCYQNNIKMYLNLLELASELNCTLISFGSGSDTDRKYWSDDMHEESFHNFPPPKNDIHADSKASIARIIKLSSFKKQLSLRLFGVFGEGEEYLFKLVPNTIAKLILEVPVVIVRDRVYNYVDVYDLARFIKIFYDSLENFGHLLSESIIPNIINFCAPNSIALSKIVSFLSLQITNKVDNFSILYSEPGQSYSGTNSRLVNSFPDFKFSCIEDSLSRQISYYKNLSHTFDKNLLSNDAYLSYAKKISH